MKTLIASLSTLRIWRDTRGQDFLEYALIAGFIASAYTAITPAIAPLVVGVFTRVTGVLQSAGG